VGIVSLVGFNLPTIPAIFKMSSQFLNFRSNDPGFGGIRLIPGKENSASRPTIRPCAGHIKTKAGQGRF
jgi:hypothetical protein